MFTQIFRAFVYVWEKVQTTTSLSTVQVRYRADSVELDLTELARAEHALLKVIGGVIFAL